MLKVVSLEEINTNHVSVINSVIASCIDFLRFIEGNREFIYKHNTQSTKDLLVAVTDHNQDRYKVNIRYNVTGNILCWYIA